MDKKTKLAFEKLRKVEGNNVYNFTKHIINFRHVLNVEMYILNGQV